METKTYRLNKKWRTIIIVLGVLCCILIVLIPLGIVTFLLAAKARIEISDEKVMIWWLGTRNIKWDEFEILRQGKLSTASLISTTDVLTRVAISSLISGPITYKLKGKKTTGNITIHWHENAKEILETFEAKTGLTIQGLK